MSSTPDSGDHRIGPSDDELLAAHEKAASPRTEDGGNYRLAPLFFLFLFSGFVLFSGTYLNRYAGRYKSAVYDENAKPGAAVAAVKISPLALGKAQFESTCITCHQATGMGIPGVYPPLAGSEWVNGSEERVIRIVLYGLKGTVHVSGSQFGAAVMPIFGQVAGSQYSWSDEQIAGVLSYVRQTWGNKAPAITTEAVAKVRKAVGDRPSWTEDELLQVK